MRKAFMLWAFLCTSIITAEQFPDNSNIVVTDLDGNHYNIDSLLDNGKHILVHQMYSG